MGTNWIPNYRLYYIQVTQLPNMPSKIRVTPPTPKILQKLFDIFMIFLTSITVTVEEVMCLVQIRRSSGGGLIILSSCSLGEVCSWVAGLYLPSDLRRRLAIMRKTTAPTTAMNSIPPTMGPTIMAMSPKARDCKNSDTQHCLKIRYTHFASPEFECMP